MLIYIVRHGLTEWNKLKKLQGAADVPLAKGSFLQKKPEKLSVM